MILYQDYLKQVLDRALIQQQNNFNQTFFKYFFYFYFSFSFLFLFILRNSQWDLIQSSSFKTKFNQDEFKRQRESYLNNSLSHSFNSINQINQQTNQNRSIEQVFFFFYFIN